MKHSRVCYRVADLISAQQLFVGDGYRAKNEELGVTGIPFARAGNINNGLQFDDADLFPMENLRKVGNKISQPQDVVFTSKGTVGRFAFVQAETPQFVYSPQLCFWRVLDRGVIHPRYLYYWMYSPEFFAQFKGVAGQTDMAEYVSLSDQRRMQITLPDIEEQETVADVLSQIDDKIELNRRTNATLEAMAQALFRSWFVDFDPVKAKAAGHQPAGMDAATAALFPSEFEESALGLIPKGWEIRPLDSIARFLNGLALQKYPVVENEQGLPVIKIAQLKRGTSEGGEQASVSIPTDYVVNDGDMLFSWSGSLDITLWCGGQGALNQHLFKVTSDTFPKWFYYLWTYRHLDEFREIAADKATTMGHIQRKHLTNAKVLVPSQRLLRKLGELLSPLIEKQIQNKIEIQSLSQIRDALLPRLISGQLRIAD